MALAAFRAPRRRLRVHEAYEAPLPGPGGLYLAVLVQQNILVQDPGHIREIYGRGYFGKGFLSGARPDFRATELQEENGGQQLPMLSSPSESLGLKGSGLRCVVSRKQEEEETGSSHRKRLRSCIDSEKPFRTACLTADTASRQEDGSRLGSPVNDVDLQDAGWRCEEAETGEHRELRRVPPRVSEVLQLSLEEAFFLVYALGCLSVYHQQEPLSVVALWRALRCIQPGFEASYAAYHHFRSRGWIPKTGGKYGAHYMLYRKGPPFYHASYSVVVESFRGPSLRPFSWRSLAALSRITANVSKELMQCYIIFPVDQSEAELDSPLCLQRLTVQEVIVSRWISSRERAEPDNL